VELLMPAKSKKQQRFMAAVANNPEFAKKVGVPQDVGEEFMKMKKYQGGGRGMDMDMAMGSRRGRRDMDMMEEARARPRPRRIPAQPPQEEMPGFAPRRRNRAGGPSRGPGMKSGGKVRGCGMATKGVRKAKMVSMKGS
jgi:hypothetical protein